MNRQEKSQVIETLKTDLSHSKAAFLVGVKGLTVSQLQSLRKDLRNQGGKLKITKARLMRIASENTSEACSELNPFFKDQIGIVFANNEPNSIAKVLYDFSKKNGALKLVVGCVENQLFDTQLITRIAQLPSREVLLAHLCGTLKAPITKMVIALDMIAKKRAEQQ